VWRGTAVLRARFEQCAAAHRAHQQLHLHLRSQAGFCDGCDLPCDGIDCVNCSGVGDCGNWGGSKKKTTDGTQGQSTSPAPTMALCRQGQWLHNYLF
jgi:hypothetical protein